MKVLYVHERFGAMGGAESNVLATARELAAYGHSVALLHGERTGKMEAAWQEAFPLSWEYSDGNGGTVLPFAIRDFCPDVVFLHKTPDLGLVQALTDCVVPVVRMVHDHDLTCMRSYKYYPLSRRICTRATSGWCLFPCGASIARRTGSGFPLKWVSYHDKLRELELNRRFARLVVASRYMEDELLRNGFPASRVVIHAPVPVPNDSYIQSSFGETNLIVYSGQIVRGKGVDLLLESLALLTVPFKAIIFGDGSHRAACERLSRQLGLSTRVRFTGFVSPVEIRKAYAESSVAVISSVWPEPFGAVGLEAMRSGLPVIGFDVGGISEWLIDGENGYLVEKMDCAQYARRIETLLLDKGLARTMGERGRELADERFGFSRYIRNLEALLVGVASESTEFGAR